MSSLFFLTGLLLLLSLMWPSEGAIQGDGLHLATAWFCVAVFAGVIAWRERQHLRFSGMTGVLILIAGFWLATWQVFVSEGDRRAAFNLTIEWTSLGAVWFLLKVFPPQYRQAVYQMLVSVCIGTAVYGFAQFFILNQQTADWYQARIAELETTASASERRAIQSELQQLGVPLGGPAQELFQRRLMDSSEPTGPFALANTFGGVLCTSIVILIGSVMELRRRGESDWRVFLVSLTGTVALGCCLILTKSRTAWVGAIVGVGVLIAMNTQSRRQIFKAVLCLLLLSVTVIGVGIGTGVLDREVVLESPKSLQYRLFYWMGASGVIRESPVFGAGPGNFRQAYLLHKVPESSEEILDPHNVFFDTWATVGIVGLAGLLTMILSVVMANRRSVDSTRTSAGGANAAGQPRTAVFWRISVTSILLLLSGRFLLGESVVELFGNPLSSQSIILSIPIVSAAFGAALHKRFLASPVSLTAAGCALLVHLSGAGGMQITVCGFLLLVLHSGITSGCSDESSQKAEIASFPFRPALMVVVCSSLGFTAVLGGLKPYLTSSHFQRISSSRLATGDISGAVEAARESAKRDPWSVNSRQQLAQTLSYVSLASLGTHARAGTQSEYTRPNVEQDLAAAETAIDDLVAADRRSVAGAVMRSQLMMEAFEITKDSSYAQRAIDDLRDVVLKYPTRVQSWAELAIFENLMGEPAAMDSCSEALRLDRINRDWGHIDRYLTSDQILQLNSMAEGRTNSEN